MTDAGWRKYLPLVLVAVVSSLTTSAVFLTMARLGERGSISAPVQGGSGIRTAARSAVGDNAFIEARRRIEPAVVYIDVQSIQPAPLDEGFYPFLSPFREFFRPRIRKGTGSGFVFRADGHILTNAHVVEGAQKLSVTLADKRKFSARVVGLDREMDLAVIKIEAQGLPAVTFGDSDRLEAGQWVLAIGNPLGYHYTVTAGIVSALNRSLENPEKNGYLIQTDAAINPGNSGGPLVDLEGRVVGINEAIVADAQGMGFAIPIKVAQDRLPDLLSGRAPAVESASARPWLGIAMGDLSDLTPEARGEYNLGQEGVFVAEVVPGSPAEQAGLERLDVIISLNRQRIKTAAQLQRLVRGLKVGQAVDLSVKRAGRVVTLRVRLGSMPAEAG
ncbi:MAG: S1C family serine protease [Bacteroidota bacterium]